jgi:acetyltransferase-like isoleucine patch superfamily enzyme
MNWWRPIERAWRALRTSGRADAFRRAHVGPSSHIDESVQVLGWKQVRIGHHSVISEGTWLNVNDRDVDAPVIVIGNNCFIGRRNFFSSGAAIKIGDYCFTGVNCNFLGADHQHTSPFMPYIVSGTTNNASIELGPNCWLGAAVTVLKGVRIGYGSIIGAGSVVTRDVPPFSMLVGNPGRVIRRYDVERKEWISASDVTASVDAMLPGEDAYLETLRASRPALKIPVIASGHVFGDI